MFDRYELISWKRLPHTGAYELRIRRVDRQSYGFLWLKEEELSREHVVRSVDAPCTTWREYPAGFRVDYENQCAAFLQQILWGLHAEIQEKPLPELTVEGG